MLRAEGPSRGYAMSRQRGLPEHVVRRRPMGAKEQGRAVHTTAGWPSALRNPVGRCMRSPESLLSRLGTLRMSPFRWGGHVHGRLSEVSDDRAAQPKTSWGRWCRTTIGHSAALAPRSPAYCSSHREGAGIPLCQCLRPCGGNGSGDVLLLPWRARPLCAGTRPVLVRLLSGGTVGLPQQPGRYSACRGLGGTNRLLDPAKALYASDGWGGKPEHLRRDLGRLPAHLGERINRVGHRVL